MMIGFQLKRVLKMGLKSLWLHRLRSVLTVLGIMFGVCSVVAMLAIGTGASEEAQEEIRRLGSHNIIIQSVKPPQNQQASQSQSFLIQYGLTRDDADLINDTIPGIRKAVTARRVRGTVMRASRRVDADLVGTTPEYKDVNNMTVIRGRFLTDSDIADKSDACVLGRGAAEVLFPLGGAVGSVIRRENLRFRVVGVVTSMPRGEIGGAKLQGDPNSEIYIPMSTMKVRFGSNIIHRSSGTTSAERVELHDLIVQVGSMEQVRPVERVVRHVLRSRHEKEDYQIVVPLHLLVQARRTKFIFNIVLGSIAAISLLVGGIGIMNITLASVMERTREIGIRRAMGAKKRHIIFQFLTETLLLALFGGTLGVIIGVVAPWLVEHFAGMRTIVTLWSLLVAFGISAAVGLGFGIYPAYRAATMDPIEALRHE
ncbi:MAG: ABC transporter permease [Candidatus Brocadiia bacterium]